jgi:hypothetical protein
MKIIAFILVTGILLGARPTVGGAAKTYHLASKSGKTTMLQLIREHLDRLGYEETPLLNNASEMVWAWDIAPVPELRG